MKSRQFNFVIVYSLLLQQWLLLVRILQLSESYYESGSSCMESFFPGLPEASFLGCHKLAKQINLSRWHGTKNNIVLIVYVN